MCSEKNNSSTSPVLREVREWVGGRFDFTEYIGARLAQKPQAICWLDPAADLVLGLEPVPPEAPASALAELLDRLTNRCEANGAKLPTRLRVASELLAAPLSAARPDLEVVVAATPELQPVERTLFESIEANQEPFDYLQADTLDAALMGRFFDAAGDLWRAAPWRVLHDDQVLRIDSVALGIDGWCASVVGAAGESFGVLLFKDLAAYDRFGQVGDEIDRAGSDPATPLDIGDRFIAVNFDHGDELDKRTRRQVAQRGWRVAGPAAYPRLQITERDLSERDLTDDDVELGCAVALTVTEFFHRHRAEFEQGCIDQTCVSIEWPDLPRRPTVEITAPHPDRPWPDPEDMDLDADESFESEGRERPSGYPAELPPLRAPRGTANQTLVLRVTLDGVKPMVWRRIEIPARYSFWDLHVALQDAMGWESKHLHEFYVDIGDGDFLEVGLLDNDDLDSHVMPGWAVAVAKFLGKPGAFARYNYDPGDGWEHEIEVEEVREKERGVHYPRCLAGARACPPEDCGGVEGYRRLRSVLKDPKHAEHSDLVEWLDGPFDPAHFDVADVDFEKPDEMWQIAFG